MNKQKRNKILKIAGIVFASLAVFLIVAVIGVLMFLGSIVKTAVEKVGPEVLGAPVKVSGVSFNIFSAAVEVKGLFIGNPAGYKHDRALTVKTLRVDLLPSSFTAPKLVVEEFTLDGVDVYFEPSSNLLSNNLSQLNRNIQSFTEKLAGPQESAGNTEPQKENPAGEPKKLQIDKLRLTNIFVNVVASAPGSPTTATPVPVIPIVLEDLGKNDEGVTALDVTAVILNKLTLGVFASVADALPSLKGVTDAGAKLIDTTGEAGKAILKTTTGAVSSIKDILNGKAKTGMKK